MQTISIEGRQYAVPEGVAVFTKRTVDSYMILLGALKTYRKLWLHAKNNPTKENRMAVHEMRKRLFELLPDEE